ncbi:MAG: hypothetical protein SPL08_00720 [Pseudomonadota bacterium]|nr:hypothetical protein [Pseudomonadota bacterium]
MRLYHYAPRQNSILKEGLGTFKSGYGDPSPYYRRAKSHDREVIITWMENSFKGRSHAISTLTEPIKCDGNDPMLKLFVDNHILISFDLDDLIRDNMIEAIWCQDGEKLYQVAASKIDCSPLPWGKCNQRKGIFFKPIRHYFIVLTTKVVHPKYIKVENIS